MTARIPEPDPAPGNAPPSAPEPGPQSDNAARRAPKPPDEELRRIWTEYKENGDAGLREHLTLHYPPPVKFVAGRVSPVTTRHGLVHHRRRWRRRSIARVNPASGHELQPERVRVSGRDAVEIDLHVLVAGRRIAGHDHGLA